MKVEIHPARQLAAADREQLQSLLNEAFGDDAIGKQYEWADNDWNLLLRREREIVSHVGVVERTVSVEGQLIKVGGIGAVATAPPWQRRGLAQQLLDQTASFLRDQLGASFGLLICGEHRRPYYARLGWQVVAGPLLIDQPKGKCVMPAIIMVLPCREMLWPPGTIDLCGLPW